MRAAQAIEHLTTQIRTRFDADIAEAILADTDLIEATARLCKDATADDVTAAVKDIAADMDDGTADWLADTAASPSGWFYSQVRDRV